MNKLQKVSYIGTILTLFLFLTSCTGTNKNDDMISQNVTNTINNSKLNTVEPASNTSTKKAIVYNIKKGQKITSPLTILGEVPSEWVSEGLFSVNLTDLDGEIIVESFGTAQWIDNDGNTIDGMLKFSTNIDFDMSPNEIPSTGLIVLSQYDISTVGENNSTKIPVKWKNMTPEEKAKQEQK